MCVKVNAEFCRDLLVSFSHSLSLILFRNYISEFLSSATRFPWYSVSYFIHLTSWMAISFHAWTCDCTFPFRFIFLSMRVLFTDECTTVHIVIALLCFVYHLIAVSVRCISSYQPTKAMRIEEWYYYGTGTMLQPRVFYHGSVRNACMCMCVYVCSVGTLDASLPMKNVHWMDKLCGGSFSLRHPKWIRPNYE